MAQKFSIDIEDVVDLLGLERKRQGRGASSFFVKCPFCSDKKHHMSINASNNTYYCVLCTGDRKGTGVLDLFGRVALGTPLVVGVNGNSKYLYAKLCEALNISNNSSARADYEKRRAERPAVVEYSRTSDTNLDAAYSAVLNIKYFRLTDAHRENLKKRGLSDEAIAANQYRSMDEACEWIDNHPAFKEIYLVERLDAAFLKLKSSVPTFKYFKKERVIAGLIVAAVLQNKGISPEGVPGFFKLGNRWCFRIEPGMLIPTRNMEGQIVAIQARKDTGKIRYMTISAKGMPHGVTEGISRAHFPMNNATIESGTTVLLTEGPLKADVALHLMKGKAAFIAIQGVQNTKELVPIFKQLKEMGVKNVVNAFDMDKLANKNVANASRTIKRIANEHGLAMTMRCWDNDYAKVKHAELRELCLANDIQLPASPDVFTRIGLMAQALEDKRIEHSIITSEDGSEIKNYWSDDTKGIDDYLLSKQHATQGRNG